MKMTYLGAQWGKFEAKDSGRKVAYAHVFVAMKFNQPENDDYHYLGRKTDKLKLSDPGLVQDLESGKVYNFEFDQKGVVLDIEPVPEKNHMTAAVSK